MNHFTTNTGAWKTEYQQRAEQTRSRRQAAGRYARPTKAQESAFKKSVMRGGDKSLSVEEMGLLATHPYLAASQRAKYATMAQEATQLVAAQERFDQMCAAMVGDDDVDALIDEVFGKPGLGVEDSAGLVDYDAELEDYQEDMLDRQYHASGAW